MVQVFFHRSQNSTVANVIAVYRVPGMLYSLQVTGFVRINAEIGCPAQSAGLSYRPLRIFVCVSGAELGVLLHMQSV